MRWLRALLFRFWGMFFGSRREQELAAELESHLQLHMDENIRRGMDADSARREAVLKLGGLEQTKEVFRERHTLPAMETVMKDFRYAFRMLRKSPVFATVAVLTLALGIGANTAIFTVVNGVLLRPLPYPDYERLVRIAEVSEKGSRMNVPEANFYDWQQSAHTVEGMAMHSAWVNTVLGGATPVRALVATVSHGFFDVLAVKPYLGRTFSREESQFGAEPVAVVSYGFWQQSLSGDVDLTRKKLTVENKSFSVIGVMPSQFEFPNKVAVWVPWEIFGEVNPSRNAHNFKVIARLKTGATPAQAQLEIGAVAKRIMSEFGPSKVNAVDVAVIPVLDDLTSRTRPALLVLFGAVGVLLLIACANVAGLLLTQATARQKELAVRAALGASRSRLLQQFVIEALVLSLAGGAAGILLSVWGTDALLAIGSQALIRVEEIRMDGRVLLFALGLSMGTAFLVALVPALRVSRNNLQEVIKEGGRGQGGGVSHQRVRGLLVGSQVALTLMLLIGAALLARSFVHLLQVDLGFHTESRLVMDVSLPSLESRKEDVKRANFIAQLEEKAAALPGVISVGSTNSLPLSGNDSNGQFEIEGGQHSPYYPSFRVVTPGYFSTVGIPLLKGRLISTSDARNSAHVAVISKLVAERVWPDQDPIGRRINYGNMDGYFDDWITIVGVVGDVHHAGPSESPSGDVYVSALQRPAGAGSLSLIVRASGEPTTLTSAVRESVRNLDPDLPMRFQTLDQVFSRSMGERRFQLWILAAFGVAALFLSLIGIYGVISYSVEQRTREIGIRMALGAQRGDVLRLMLRQGVTIVLGGIVTGLVAAFALNQVMKTFLFGITSTDPFTFGAVSLLLLGVALLAIYWPARRAAQVDPLVALRYE